MLIICDETQPQFRDKLFISRLNFTHSASSTIASASLSKINRSPWTNKIIKQKQTALKLKSFQRIFDNQRVNNLRTNNTPTHSIKVSKQNFIDQKMICQKIRASQIQYVSSTTRKNSKISNHFVFSKPYFSKQIHNDLPKTDILIQNCEQSQQSDSRSFHQVYKDPRVFQKNWKIKANLNLYKGNFTKFTKKQTNHKQKTKACQLTLESEVSPWEIDKNIHYLC